MASVAFAQTAPSLDAAAAAAAATSGNSAAQAAAGLVPGVQIPGTNLPPGSQNLSPEQVKSLLMLRALQMRGRGGVQRGAPQFVPFGAMGYSPPAAGPQGPFQPDPAAGANSADPAADRDAARQRRVDALKANAEKQREAREARAEKRKAEAAARAKQN